MPQVLLLRGVKQLLTLRGPSGARRGAALNDLGLIEDGSVLIQDGKIISVGPTRRIENLKEARNASEIPVHGGVVMPGFIDPGIYVTMYDRSLRAKSPPKRKKTFDFQNESLTLMRACLQHGTLHAGIRTYADQDRTAGDWAALRTLSQIGSNPVGMVRSIRLGEASPSEESLNELAVKLRQLKSRDLASFVDVMCHGDRLRGEAIWRLIRKAGLNLDIIWEGGSGNRLWQTIREAAPRAVFCTNELSAAESAALAVSNTTAVFFPCKELLDERENRAAQRLAAAEGAIALATGYDAKDAPIFSMQMVVALAVLRLRLTVEQAISAATINAAHALGLQDETGSLEVGKRADMVVLSLADYHEIPRRFGVNHISMVIRDGAVVLNRNRAKASAV